MSISLIAVLAGCPSVAEGPDDDDSTPGADDDDSSPPTDDDDTDPPLFTFEAFSVGLELEVAAPTVAATFVITYWEDLDLGLPACDQLLTASGSAAFGSGVVPDCPACVGALAFDPESVSDGSDPDDPDHCRSYELAEMGDWGAPLLTPPPDGYGDLLTLALLGAEDQALSGLDLALEGGLTAEALAATAAEDGLVYAHAAFVDAGPSSLASVSGLTEVAASPGGSWRALLQLLRDPAVNDHEGGTLMGSYLGRSLWSWPMSR